MAAYGKSRAKYVALQIACVVYMLSLIFPAALLGSIYRHEQPMWLLDKLSAEPPKAGAGEIVYQCFVYLDLYISAFLLPLFAVIIFAMINRPPNDEHPETFPMQECVVVSTWIGTTLLLFHDAVMEFYRNLPWDRGTVLEWAIILWAVGGIWIVFTAGRFYNGSPP